MIVSDKFSWLFSNSVKNAPRFEWSNGFVTFRQWICVHLEHPKSRGIVVRDQLQIYLISSCEKYTFLTNLSTKNQHRLMQSIYSRRSLQQTLKLLIIQRFGENCNDSEFPEMLLPLKLYTTPLKLANFWNLKSMYSQNLEGDKFIRNGISKSVHSYKTHSIIFTLHC